MINLGWIAALFVWAMGMWLAYQVNQAIIDIEYRELMSADKLFFVMVCVYSVLTILLWPLVQLISMQRSFSASDKKEN